MKKAWEIVVEITSETLCVFMYFVKSNLVTFANILLAVLPYLMYFLGQHLVVDRQKVAIGGEIFIPIFFILIVYYLKSAANKLGKGITVPIPEKRFTQIDEDGEVSIENKRIQELILYLADLEDWLERKGLL